MRVLRLTLVASLLCLAMVAPAVAPADPASSAAAAGAEPAPTAHAAGCPDAIRLGSRRYAYYQRRVDCTRARRAVRRLYTSRGRRGAPRGFRCRSQNSFRKSGGCSTRGRTRYFGFSR